MTLPPETPDTKDWWDATRDQRLTVQRCMACGHHQLYPRILCTSCHARDLELVDASGEATIHSFSVVHRSPDPDQFPAPYMVALVKLAEGPLLTSRIVDVDHDAVTCDQPVTLQWEPLSDGRNLLVFTPTSNQD